MLRRSLPIVISLLLLTVIPHAAAGSQEAPEMPDRAGDADPLSLTGLKPEELAFVQGNLSMFDIRDAWVTGESESQFFFVIDVVDLMPDLEGQEENLSLPEMMATFEVHFKTGSDAWLAQAAVAPMPVADAASDPPNAQLMWHQNYTLHKDDVDRTVVAQLSGGIATSVGWVYIQVPKDALGSPAPGAQMVDLYAVARFGGHIMDTAPDATLDPTQVDPGTLDPEDPSGSALVPQYGSPYEYGQYRDSGAAPRIELEAQGPDSVTVAPGESADLAVQVRNVGSHEQTIRFTTRDPSGWGTSLNAVAITLAPGSSDALVVTVTPAEGARTPGILKLDAATPSESQSLLFTLQTPAPLGGGDGPEPTQEDPQQPADTEGSPAPLALAPLLVATLLLLRRRH